MDRYIFRGKCKDIWLKGFLVFDELGTPYICKNMGVYAPVKKETVGQCTGLKDRNGKLIFSDDVCKSIDGIFLVAWSDEKCAFLMRFHDETLYMEEMWEDAEIIGNIHDNRWEDFI